MYDMTFCITNDCPIKDCHRHYSHLEGHKPGMIVSLSDFGNTCSRYVEYKATEKSIEDNAEN